MPALSPLSTESPPTKTDDTEVPPTRRQQAKDLILRSSGASRTLDLAAAHSAAAIEALHRLPESDARDALEKMARDVLTRKK